ncbi:hypothetical protein cyc_03590 [Cyclospora cayetanensis]|uniref:DNA2/NAM7 helicase-like C-terminal domain-containing protein n=1 Tax=Cyclospora cayetanensis TaxID=88456 RepID=A0A1D3CSY1_9EIME|nr:hypothetical protein cyc_03590 [Cyclospora cayetanensis]
MGEAFLPASSSRGPRLAEEPPDLPFKRGGFWRLKPLAARDWYHPHTAVGAAAAAPGTAFCSVEKRLSPPISSGWKCQQSQRKPLKLQHLSALPREQQQRIRSVWTQQATSKSSEDAEPSPLPAEPSDALRVLKDAAAGGNAGGTAAAPPLVISTATTSSALNRRPRVISECSGCSLSTPTAWRKWLLLLAEENAQRRQQLLLAYPFACKKHRKSLAASDPGGTSVVGFAQLLRMLEAAALYPHATEAAVAALRQRVQLGVPAAAAAVAHARQLSERLAYAERGLYLLTLEKGAQLLQVRGWVSGKTSTLDARVASLKLPGRECIASSSEAATEVVGGPPVERRSEKTPLFALENAKTCERLLASQQQATPQQLESGSLLVLKPVDEVRLGAASAVLAKALRRLHGNAFDFSSITAEAREASWAAAGATNVTESKQQLRQLLQEADRKHSIQCAACGSLLMLSVCEMTQQPLHCPNCAATTAASPSAASFASSHENPLQQEGAATRFTAMRHVLQQLASASSLTADRFALDVPTYVAVVGSRSKPQSLRLRVVPLPAAAARAAAGGSSGAASGDPRREDGHQGHSADAAKPSEGGDTAPALPERQQASSRDDLLPPAEGGAFAVSAGARFWAMPVSFVSAVHARQIDALKQLVDDAAGARPPGTGKTAVAAAVVRQWLCGAACRAQSACNDPHCTCRAPIFVAAGTHAALRSLKNKLDLEGVETVRLSDEATVSVALDRASSSRQGVVLLDTVYQVKGNEEPPDAEFLQQRAYVAVAECGRRLDCARLLHLLQGYRLSLMNLRPARVLVDESSQLTEFAGLGALVHGAEVAVFIGDEKQLPPATSLPPHEAPPRSLFSALKGGEVNALSHALPVVPRLLLTGSLMCFDAHYGRGDEKGVKKRGIRGEGEAQWLKEAAVYVCAGKPSRLLQLRGVCGAVLHAGGACHGERDCGSLTRLELQPTASASSKASKGGRTDGGRRPDEQRPRLFRLASEPLVAKQETAAATESLSRFPWPNGSEGDKDLAVRLLRQMQREAYPLGCLQDASHPPGAPSLQDFVPERLPILFIDTSPWASSARMQVARVSLPREEATAAAVASRGRACTTSQGQECPSKGVVQCLFAEQRVKGSLQNPLEAFLVFRCVEMLLNSGASKADLAVLTPYQAQAQLLSRILHPPKAAGTDTHEKRRRSSRLSFVQPVRKALHAPI